ncbi:MAG: phosphoglycerate kinase [Alphaproteobacteria bacterium]|tara:strand:+ start:268 stop:1461 length:1194 start_codon:yes stop_codon:yes gene_type:complete
MITLKKKFSDSFNFVYNKLVLVRVDLNIPIVDGKVTDTTRIEKILPTINKLLENKAKVILIAHMGRPKGNWVQEFSLRVLVNLVSNYLDKKIFFCDDSIIDLQKINLANKFKDYDLVLLENIRFYPQEEKNDKDFTKKLSSLGDIFINECFSGSHRNHSSISGIPSHIPSFPGQLLENEIQNLKNLFLISNQLNSIAVLGGSKISTKIKLIKFYAERFEKVLIGGAMANTLLKSNGVEIGASVYEKKMIEFSKEMIGSFHNKLLLPVDFIVCDKKIKSKPRVKIVEDILKDDFIYDIGPKTRVLFFNEIVNANIALWNGPLGMFETKPFDEGTSFVLKSIKANKNKNFFSVAGGGDTISIINKSNCYNDFSFVSTGGGAFLEFIQGTSMPGLLSLNT